jgi:hypothetical protein
MYMLTKRGVSEGSRPSSSRQGGGVRPSTGHRAAHDTATRWKGGGRRRSRSLPELNAHPLPRRDAAGADVMAKQQVPFL